MSCAQTPLLEQREERERKGVFWLTVLDIPVHEWLTPLFWTWHIMAGVHGRAKTHGQEQKK
jgi:hypothetical protein